MNRALAEMRAVLHFVKEGFRNLDKTASVIPSSPRLVEAMLRPVPLETARCVVELGPGTGTLTKEILRRLPADGHVHAIELDAKMNESTARRFAGDPRLLPVHGNALDVASLLEKSGCSPCADAVVSSLGLSIMPDDLREAIVRAAVEVLAPEGTLTQYNYAHTRFFVMSPETMYYRVFHAGRFLGGFFEQVEQEFIGVNIPPAFVYTCRGPLHGPLARNPASVGRAARLRRHAPAAPPRRISRG